MIKMIITIDTFRGMYCNPTVPSVAKYQSKIASKGHLSSPEAIISMARQNDESQKRNVIVWAKNGLKIQKELLKYVDELYITQLDGNFSCESYLPPFENDFVMVARGKIKQKNNILFQHQVWQSKKFGKSPID
jgi:dihydrofolate reductase